MRRRDKTLPIYTFYPRMNDGSALTFNAVELADDQAAVDHCLLVLSEHMSATEVVVWDGDRRVHGIGRGVPPRTPPRADVDRAGA
jgi:hypothetical protein